MEGSSGCTGSLRFVDMSHLGTTHPVKLAYGRAPVAGPRLICARPHGPGCAPIRSGALRRRARCAERAGHDGLLLEPVAGIDVWRSARTVLDATDRLTPVVSLTAPELSPVPELAGRLIELAARYGRSPHVLLVGDGAPGLVRSDYAEALLSHLPAGGGWRCFLAPASGAAHGDPGRGVESIAPVAPNPPQGGSALRVGIVTRSRAEDAERIAAERFPEARALRVEHRIGLLANGFDWVRPLDRLTDGPAEAASPWRLEPLEHGYTSAPYLVGDHRTVARALLPALSSGCRWLLVETAGGAEDLAQAAEVVHRAVKRAATRLAVAG